jgi:small conductance mechanosensitive channel
MTAPLKPPVTATPAHSAGPGGLTTAGDDLINVTTAAIHHFVALKPAEIGVNLALTAAILTATGGAAFGFHRLVERQSDGGDMAAQLRASRAVRWAGICVRTGLTLIGVYLVLAVWGFDPLGWWAGAGGREVLRVTVRVLILGLIFLGASELAGFLIRRTLGNLASGARDPRRAAQLRTLSPLLRGLVQAMILIMAGMMLLSELGLQIGPLIAGAGVAGIAIGFGAQSVVKDILTGFFLIVEDIVSVGDTVRIASCSGEVETMTLRTIRLRDFDGTLHIFPYGEAQVIHNMTKTFSYAVIDLQISYGSDVEVAMAAMAQVGESLTNDPVYGPRILAKMEVLGIENLRENGLQLRGRIKTRTGADAGVTREFNRRIKTVFDDKGIVIPYPHMRLILPEGLTPEAEELVSAAVKA